MAVLFSLQEPKSLGLSRSIFDPPPTGITLTEELSTATRQARRDLLALLEHIIAVKIAMRGWNAAVPTVPRESSLLAKARSYKLKAFEVASKASDLVDPAVRSLDHLKVAWQADDEDALIESLRQYDYKIQMLNATLRSMGEDMFIGFDEKMEKKREIEQEELSRDMVLHQRSMRAGIVAWVKLCESLRRSLDSVGERLQDAGDLETEQQLETIYADLVSLDWDKLEEELMVVCIPFDD